MAKEGPMGSMCVGMHCGLVIDQPKGRKGRLGAVYGKRVGMVQVVPIRPPSHACSARQLLADLSL